MIWSWYFQVLKMMFPSLEVDVSKSWSLYFQVLCFQVSRISNSEELETKVSNFIKMSVVVLSIEFFKLSLSDLNAFHVNTRHSDSNFESRLFNWVLTSPRLELQLSFKVTKTFIFILFCPDPELFSLRMMRNQVYDL